MKVKRMYILIAILSYFLSALAITLDKFLLSSRRIPTPAVYAFFIGLLGILSFALFPFGFFIPPVWYIFASLLGGMLFIYGIFCLYCAIKNSEASRIAPLGGTVIILTSFFISLAFLKEPLNLWHVAGVAFLLLGGALISLDWSPRPQKFMRGALWAIAAGILVAVSFSVFKVVYQNYNFINGFIWTRFGLVAGAATFLLIPSTRKEIAKALHSFGGKARRKKGTGTAILFFVNKGLGGLGSLLTNWAIALGSVAIVNALIPVQYVFVFILASLFSLKKPDIFGEELDSRVITQKFFSIVIISAGIVLVALGNSGVAVKGF